MGLVPAIVALAAVALSVHSMGRAPSAVQGSLAFTTLLLNVPSLWIMKRIFIDGAWPTALPHLVIAVTLVVAVVQWRLAVRSSAKV